MEEAEAVCDSVALIDKGRLLAIETPARLARLVATIERVDFTSRDDSLPGRLRALDGIAAVSDLDADSEYRVELSHEAALPNVLGFLLSAGVTSIRTSRPSLAEVYLHVIGNRGLKI